MYLPYDEASFDAVVDVVSLQNLSLENTRQAFGEIFLALKPAGYRLSDRSVMLSAPEGRRVDVATLLNVDGPVMPLANNGAISFWSPSLARMMYDQIAMELISSERVGRAHANDVGMGYPSMIGRRG